jgi:hypothetical protein
LGLFDDLQDSSESWIEFNLPWSAAVAPSPPSEEYVLAPLLRFPRPGGVASRRRGGLVEVALDGRNFRFEEEVVMILERICESPAPTVRDLIEHCRGQIPGDRVGHHLSELIKSGIVSAREPSGAGLVGGPV